MSEIGAVTIVVPCYNEAARLSRDLFLTLADTGALRILFVDDGSTDGTRAVLEDLRDKSSAIQVIGSSTNLGKAESVRRGLIWAIEQGSSLAGYYDADMSTPAEELLELVRVLETTPRLDAVLGSRVARLGSSIERSAVRHYLGRLYATAASLALGIAVYDTQCGTKVFRVTSHLKRAVSSPFRSSWAFDVELLQRLMMGTDDSPGLHPDQLLEVPLRSWQHVPGSKLRLRGAIAAFVDLATIVRVRHAAHIARAQREVIA